jgi:hypothetical protein
VKNAVPGNAVLDGTYVDFRDLMTMTADEEKRRKQEALRDMEITDKAGLIVQRNSKTAYTKALKTLQPDIQEWWQDLLEEGEVEATPADLRKFILNDLLPVCRCQLAVICHHEAIKSYCCCHVAEPVTIGNYTFLVRFSHQQQHLLLRNTG